MCTDRATRGGAILVAAVVAAAGAWAADPRLVVSASDGPVTVGDPVEVRVQARADEPLLWGELTVTVTPDGQWELVEGPTEVAGARPPAWQLTLAPMAVGTIPLPAVQSTARPPDGDPRAVTAEALPSIEVASVLPPEGDVQPAPLRDPVGVRGLPWEWIGPMLIVLIPALLVQYWWLRRRRSASLGGDAAALSPLERLERLARELVEGLQVAPAEEVCDRLAAGLRGYLERRTGEPAQEMTSFELRVLARRLGWPEPVQRGIHRVMQVVDGVRFGRRPAAEGELRQAIDVAVDAARGLDVHLTPAADDLEAAS